MRGSWGEEDTVKRLRAYRRELIDVRITGYRGRIVRETGDGLLVEFPSIVDAVRCAIDVQQQSTTGRSSSHGSSAGRCTTSVSLTTR